MVVSHSLKANIWENEFKFEFELPFKWIVPMHVPCSTLHVGCVHFGMFDEYVYDCQTSYYWNWVPCSLESHIWDVWGFSLREKKYFNFPNRSFTIICTPYMYTILLIALMIGQFDGPPPLNYILYSDWFKIVFAHRKKHQFTINFIYFLSGWSNRKKVNVRAFMRTCKYAGRMGGEGDC